MDNQYAGSVGTQVTSAETVGGNLASRSLITKTGEDTILQKEELG
jgi:hypothetical protein